MVWPAIAAAAVPVIAGAIGNAQAGKARKDAERRSDEMAELYRSLNVPSLESQQYDPTMQDYAGDIDPALLASIPGLESALSQVTSDPRFTQAQYQSLGGLDELVAGGGMTQMDKLEFQRAQDQAGQESARQQASITRDMAERGIAGGGMELAQRLASAQGAANTSSAAAQNMAATAQQRALQALMERGNMAGDMQSQDFGRKSTAANARDMMAKWNQEQALGVNKANANAANAAAAQNQQTRQYVNKDNQYATNNAKQNNAQAVGQQYGQQMDRLSGIAGQVTGQNAHRQAQAAQIGNQAQGIGQAASTIIPAAANMYQQYQKNNMSGEELEAYEKRNK